MLDIVYIFLLTIKLSNAKQQKHTKTKPQQNLPVAVKMESHVLSEMTYSSAIILHSCLIERVARGRKTAFISVFAGHKVSSGCTTVFSSEGFQKYMKEKMCN